MTEEASQPESRRVSAAHSKLKCSGTQPCDRCQRRRRECIYDARDGRNPDEERFVACNKQCLETDSTAGSGLPRSERVSTTQLLISVARIK
ncbi:hypothetical protein H2202_005667 [Exophiala xenobiotica]|nr:hypothetical protein H2202_005667 [Exophiala xenobiotica]